MTYIPMDNSAIREWYLDALQNLLINKDYDSPTHELIDSVITIYGSGPFSQTEFESFVNAHSLGYRCLAASDSSMFQYFLDEHNQAEGYVESGSDEIVLIVGREMWDEDELLQLIDIGVANNQDVGLRVYSQEMFLFWMMTGVDPYKAPIKIQDEFRCEHPALMFLFDPYDLPDSEYEQADFEVEVESELDTEWELGLDIEELAVHDILKPASLGVPQYTNGVHEEKRTTNKPQRANDGILRVFGYAVGRSGERDPRKWKSILRDVFCAKELPELDGVNLAGWGEPGSEQRLRKMANSLAWQAKAPQNRKKIVAISNWRNDLKWLKDEFYEGRFTFRWPTTEW